VQKLRDDGLVSDAWWDAYCARQIDTKEKSFAQRQQAKKEAAKVVSMVPRGMRKSEKAAGRK